MHAVPAAVRVRDGHTQSGDLAKSCIHASTLSHCALSLYQGWLETAAAGIGSLPHERKQGKGAWGLLMASLLPGPGPVPLPTSQLSGSYRRILLAVNQRG